MKASGVDGNSLVLLPFEVFALFDTPAFEMACAYSRMVSRSNSTKYAGKGVQLTDPLELSVSEFGVIGISKRAGHVDESLRGLIKSLEYVSDHVMSPLSNRFRGTRFTI